MKLTTQAEFDQLETRRVEIEAKEFALHRMKVSAMAAFFTALFGLGYYTIFCVPWLGWDLVEPVTYTIGQGSFILGLLIVMRNRGAGIEYSELEQLYSRTKRKKWLKKYNFDLKRHAFLKRKLERIEE